MHARPRAARSLPLLLVALTACRTAAPAAADGTPSLAAADAATPCAATVPGVDVSRWRIVRAERFTFCVPPEWQGAGNTWRRGSSSVTWGVGEPTRRLVRTETRVVSARELAATPAGPTDGEQRRFAERIGDRDAVLWRNRMGREYFTGARWETPRVWLTGEADAPHAADLHLQIFRTARFATPAGTPTR